LVVTIAKKFLYTTMPLEDIVDEGINGLMAAIDRWDAEFIGKIRLSTYASWWIKQAIQRGIKQRADAIRLPPEIHELRHKWFKKTEELRIRYNREPTHGEINRCLKLPKSQLGRLLQALKVHQPQAFEDYDEDLTPDIFKAPANKAPNPAEVVEQQERICGVTAMLNKLGERDRKIILRRFGLDGQEPATLEIIGQEVGLTRERVRQIVAKALKRLKFYDPDRRAEVWDDAR
jgi:RNA polymerase sigma factor (sigma-70 family)